MGEIKVFAMYLPQYHEVEENSKFWGKGFTDWVTVRKAESLFEGHEQPIVPFDKNYYDLSKLESIKKQVSLANKYGIDGWGIYHYWFNNEKCLLTKPAELILANKDINISFFFAWDNASWKRTWSKLAGNDWSPLQDEEKINKINEPEILIEYILGNENDWEKHFNYLLPYFRDGRYIKHNNKPLFLVYNYSEEIEKMSHYWNELAKKNGFSGIEIVYSYNPLHGIPKNAYKFTYEPLFSGWGNYVERAQRLLFRNRQQKQVRKFSYDKVWKNIIRNAKRCKDGNRYFGAFVNYDDTPRRGNKGKVILGGSPEKFSKYLRELIKISKSKNKDYIFLTAWNEWGEGAILEPSEKDGEGYLHAYKAACERDK